ncbi:unnamed protein product [Amoebophrya sp. A120]|nr:unnamed protein product [Amoebophrya sp. A120]|eukprot:GSA120T00014657001.1
MSAPAADAPVSISLVKRSGGVRQVALPRDEIGTISGTDDVYVPHLRKLVYEKLREEAPPHWSCISARTTAGDNPLRVNVAALDPDSAPTTLFAVHTHSCAFFFECAVAN